MPLAIPFTDAELTAYVEEGLRLDRSVELERELRNSATLRARLHTILSEQESGCPSVTEFWRRRRIACPERSTWQAYDQGQIRGEFREYLRFHLEEVGCRYCAANLADLQCSDDGSAAGRVRKFFETSVGRLKDLPHNADSE